MAQKEIKSAIAEITSEGVLIVLLLVIIVAVYIYTVYVHNAGGSTFIFDIPETNFLSNIEGDKNHSLKPCSKEGDSENQITSMLS